MVDGGAVRIKEVSTSPHANKGVNMKGGQNLAVLKQRKEEEEGWVKPQPCCICQKVIKGAYGFHEDGWTCSGACEKVYDLRPKYPGHSEEEFFQRQEANNALLEVQD